MINVKIVSYHKQWVKQQSELDKLINKKRLWRNHHQKKRRKKKKYEIEYVTLFPSASTSRRRKEGRGIVLNVPLQIKVVLEHV